MGFYNRVVSISVIFDLIRKGGGGGQATGFKFEAMDHLFRLQGTLKPNAWCFAPVLSINAVALHEANRKKVVSLQGSVISVLGSPAEELILCSHLFPFPPVHTKETEDLELDIKALQQGISAVLEGTQSASYYVGGCTRLLVPRCINGIE